MLRCCKGAALAEPGPPSGLDPLKQPRMHFPMWVMPIKTFLSMSGPPKSHQELQDEGTLVKSGALEVLPVFKCCAVLLRAFELSPCHESRVSQPPAWTLP